MFKKYFTIVILVLIFFSFNYTTTNNLNELYYPTDYLTITSNYGYRELYGKPNFHTGTDFGAPQGSNIYSISGGTVSFIGFLNGYGNTVIITHTNGYRSLYAHISESFLVHNGQLIYPHQLIATVGPKILSKGILNGNTTGPHLHLTVYDNQNNLINPLNLNMKRYT